MSSGIVERPQPYPTDVADPNRGLRLRRERLGLPTGPLEPWQVIELETVAKVAQLRARGVC